MMVDETKPRLRAGASFRWQPRVLLALRKFFGVISLAIAVRLLSSNAAVD
jgi:hypothetical protein